MTESMLPSSVTLADMREAAEILRQRAKRIVDGGNYSYSARARSNALHRIADWIDAKALADA